MELRDPLLPAIGGGWVAALMLSFYVYVRLVEPSVDACMWVVMAAMGMTWAFGPGWFWAGLRFGWGRLKQKRYRIAAFAANCLLALLVALPGLFLIALLVGEFREV